MAAHAAIVVDSMRDSYDRHVGVRAWRVIAVMCALCALWALAVAPSARADQAPTYQYSVSPFNGGGVTAQQSCFSVPGWTGCEDLDNQPPGHQPGYSCAVDSGTLHALGRPVWDYNNMSGTYTGFGIWNEYWRCVWQLEINGNTPGLPNIETGTYTVTNVAVNGMASTAYANQGDRRQLRIGPNGQGVCTWNVLTNAYLSCPPNTRDYGQLQLYEHYTWADTNRNDWHVWLGGVTVDVRDDYRPEINELGLGCGWEGIDPVHFVPGWCRGTIAVRARTNDNNYGNGGALYLNYGLLTSFGNNYRAGDTIAFDHYAGEGWQFLEAYRHDLDVDGNPANNYSSAYANRSIETDTTIPYNVSVSCSPGGWTRFGATCTPSGAGDGRSGFRNYNHDGNPLTAENSVTFTTEGIHTGAFQAVDNVIWGGNWASALAYVDQSAPTLPALSGCPTNNSWVNTTGGCTVTTSGSVDQGPNGGAGLRGYETTLRYSDGVSGWDAWQAWVAGGTRALTQQGHYEFQGRSCDNTEAPGNCSAGNLGQVGIDWTPPTNPPNLTATANPTASDPQLDWGDSVDQPGLSGLRGYNVYRGAVKLTSTPIVATNYTDAGAPVNAAHDYRITAVDNAGNESTGSTLTVTVDINPPSDPDVPAGAAGDWEQCTVDPSGPGRAYTGFTLSGATDLSAVTYHYQIRLASGTFGPVFSSTDEPTVVRLGVTDDGPWGNNNGIVEPERGEGSGVFVIEYWVTDALGNSSTHRTSSPLSIDCTPPTITTVTDDDVADTWTNRGDGITFTGTASDDHSGIDHYERQTRNMTTADPLWQDNTGAVGIGKTASDTGVYTEIADGITMVRMRAVDEAGNVGPWGPAHDFADPETQDEKDATAMLDRVDPEPPVIDGHDVQWRPDSPRTLHAHDATDALSGIDRYEQRSVSAAVPDDLLTTSSEWSAWQATGATESTSPAFATETDHRTEFRVYDRAGNHTTVTAIARIDATPPTIPATDPATGSTNWIRGRTYPVRAFGASDPPAAFFPPTPGPGIVSEVQGYEYQVSTSGPLEANFTAPPAWGSEATLRPGEQWVRFRAVDNAGNRGPWSDPILVRLAFGDRFLAYSWAEGVEDALCNLPSTDAPARTDCPSGGFDWDTRYRSNVGGGQ